MPPRCVTTPRSRPTVLWLLSTLVWPVCMLGSGGCTSHHDQLVEFLRSHEVEVAAGKYVVQTPDVIEIHSPDVPEVDGSTCRIRPDGKIVLRLIGAVDVAGLTTEEIGAKLAKDLSRYYVDPTVMVRLAGSNSKYYYIFGEVGQAGPQRCTGRDTLVQALSRAQPNFLAWESQIRVHRPSPTGDETKTVVVDLNRMLKDGDMSQDFLLQPGDIIEVPPTPLAWLGLRVRELLYPVSPVMSAYTTPASAISATNQYEQHFADEEDDDDVPGGTLLLR